MLNTKGRREGGEKGEQGREGGVGGFVYPSFQKASVPVQVMVPSLAEGFPFRMLLL